MRRSGSRVKLKPEALRPPSEGLFLIATTFGVVSKRWEYRVGRVAEVTRSTAVLEFKDKHGAWQERYSLRSGIRLEDIGRQEGWRISVKELSPEKSAQQATQCAAEAVCKRQHLAKVHEEEVPLESGSVLVVTVYAFRGCTDPREFFMKATLRTEVVEDLSGTAERRSYVRRYHEEPGVVSFAKLIELMYEFGHK